MLGTTGKNPRSCVSLHIEQNQTESNTATDGVVVKSEPVEHEAPSAKKMLLDSLRGDFVDFTQSDPNSQTTVEQELERYICEPVTLPNPLHWTMCYVES